MYNYIIPMFLVFGSVVFMFDGMGAILKRCLR